MRHPERRRVGRPPIREGEKSVYVTLAIPATQYDQLDEQRRQQRLASVPEVIRRRLRDDADE